MSFIFRGNLEHCVWCKLSHYSNMKNTHCRGAKATTEFYQQTARMLALTLFNTNPTIPGQAVDLKQYDAMMSLAKVTGEKLRHPDLPEDKREAILNHLIEISANMKKFSDEFDILRKSFEERLRSRMMGYPIPEDNPVAPPAAGAAQIPADMIETSPGASAGPRP